MASNETTIADNIGEYSDWIELYNTNNFSIDLANYYLSDSPTNLTKFRFTSVVGQVVIPANGHLIIWASGVTTRGAKHISFSLSIEGEAIVLTAPNGTTIVDGFAFGKQRTDVSYGRLPDGGVDFKYFSPSSPNNLNNASNSYIGILPSPVFSHRGGFYSTPFALTLTHIDASSTIYYTEDGSIPNSNHLNSQTYSYRNGYTNKPNLYRTFRSNLYTTPISITDKTPQPNQISTISTTYSGQILPLNNLYKGHTVKAIAYKHGYLPSDPATNSFFFSPSGSNKYSLPVISITSPESGLFSFTDGIYVPGVDFETWRLVNTDANGESPANYWRKGELAERKASLEIIENDTSVVSTNIGIRINGGWTRAERMKSLRVYTKQGDLNYRLFPELTDKNYTTFLLRNAGNDFEGSFFLDAFIQSMVQHLKFDTQNYRASIVFLNGEYWGIHNIRERYDADYFNRVYGIDKNNIDIIESSFAPSSDIDAGDALYYNSMYNYIVNNDINLTANYNYIKTQMDIENFIDYNIAQIYAANTDWPHNNILYWREKVAYNPNAPYGRDGRIRWAMFDTDYGFRESKGVGYNKISQLMYDNTYPWSTEIFRKLIKNTTFKEQFISRFADQLNTGFLSSRVASLIDEKRAGIESVIQEHLARWNMPYSEWQAKIDFMHSFVQQRPSILRTHIMSQWRLSGEYNLTVNVSNTSHGYVRVNSIDILPTTSGVSSNPYPWTGSYFNNIPIQIRPIAKQGYRFKHWVHNSTILSDSVITVNTNAAQSYTAVFELYIISPNPTPVAANLNLCGYSFRTWPSTSPMGTSPESMKFVYMADNDPLANSMVVGFTSGAYNLSSRSRINGLGDLGVSFINTGNSEGNVGYPGMKLGGAILALNTTEKSNVSVSWVGRTIVANSRVYKIRLQYRIGDIQPFNDLLDSNGQVVEYSRGVSGSFQQMPTVNLPSILLNQPYIQLLWRYYYTGIQNDVNSGSRDELGVDEITIKSEKMLSGNSISGSQIESSDKIISSSNVSFSNPMLYKASQTIILTPGFRADPNTVFTAQIMGCQ